MPILTSPLTYDLEVPSDLEFIPLRVPCPCTSLVAADHPLGKGDTSVTVETLVDYPMVLLDLPISRAYFLQRV